MNGIYWVIGFILLALTMAWLERRRLRQIAAERKLIAQQVDAVIETDFKKIDLIYGGKRWLGVEAEIVCARYPYSGEQEFRQELLCQTHKKTWFVVVYNMNELEIVSKSVSPSNDDYARSWLEYDRATYTKFFDMPEVA